MTTSRGTFVGFWIDPKLAERLKAFAGTRGLTPSDLMREAVSIMVDGEELPSRKPIVPSKARREGKITIRLPEDVRQKLEDEARGNGYPPSSWAAALIAARQRKSPQPVRGERKAIQKGFRQLRGMATNINQIANVMNRGALTGVDETPPERELLELKQQVAALRYELREFAAGRYTYQTGARLSDE